MTTTLYLRDSLADISRGRNDANKAASAVPWRALTAGTTVSTTANVVTTVNTVAGATSGIEPGSPSYEWLSGPIAAASLGYQTGLVASDAATGDAFGYSTACSATGSVVVVGAPWVGTDRGKVYIYSGSNWTTETGKTASDAAAYDRYGECVACSDDGSVVVVGAPTMSSSADDIGNAYVYSGTTWGTETKLSASDQAAGDGFGRAVACSSDGSVVVVGAPFEDGSGTDRGAVYVYSGSSWATETKKTASDAENFSWFGLAVACSADGSIIVVGAAQQDVSGTNRGKVYIYSGSNWGTETTLTASDAADNDYFGYSVACSADASVVVVGAYVEDAAGTNRGSVYVFSGANWATQTKLIASNGVNFDQLGYAVACSADGGVVFGGANFREVGGTTDAGSVYVFSGPQWSSEDVLQATDAATNDNFGYSLAASSDGNLAVVGAYNKTGGGKAYICTPGISGTVTFNMCALESNMNANATVAVIAERVNNVGAVVSTIVDSSFGTELGTSNARKTWTASPTATKLNQGDRIRVRAYFDDATASTMAATYSCSLAYDGTNANTGDSNVQFTENLTFMSAPPVGSGEVKQLTASDAANNDEFGYSVACSADGSVVVVGAENEAGAGGGRGKVYIYSGSNWSTETTLTASDTANSDFFGHSVACSADGSVVVVGAIGEDGAGTDRGAVYIYSGSNWGTETKKTASDAANSDYFGRSVACSADGSIVVVGAEGVNGGGTDRGKVYIYSGINWGTETGKTASDTANDDYFGYSVACSADGSIIVVGASGEDGTGTDRGKVYIYSGSNWGTETTLTASDAADGDRLGVSVACSDDGSVVVAGANWVGAQVGKAYIYSGSNWSTETAKTASDAGTNAEFGRWVACSADGSVVVIAAPYAAAGGTDRGEVYVYSGTTWGTETQIIASDPSDAGDWFGFGTTCSADGAMVVSGAYNKSTARGKVYVNILDSIAATAGRRLYLTDTASTIADQGTLEKTAWTTRGND